MKPRARGCEILSKMKLPEILAYLAMKTEQNIFKDVQDKVTDERKKDEKLCKKKLRSLYRI